MTLTIDVIDAVDVSGLSAMRLLLVDDNPVNLELLHELLETAGFTELLCLQEAERVAAVCDSWRPDLVLLDLHMPGRTGLEVLADLRERTTGPDGLPVIVVTADSGVEARHAALAGGARDFVSKPFDTLELQLRVRAHLATRRLQVQLRDQNAQLDRAVAERTRKLAQERVESLAVLASVAEYHDDDTHRHTRRVGALASVLARSAGDGLADAEMLRDAAPLHDIGKIVIPSEILRKPGPLTADERRVIQRHAQAGSTILRAASSPVLRLAEEIARSHHERWDGHGYPARLTGHEIPRSGRIVAIADVLDALTHPRPYKAAWPLDRALAQIRTDAGTHFDPELAGALRAIDREELARLLDLPSAPDDARRVLESVPGP